MRRALQQLSASRASLRPCSTAASTSAPPQRRNQAPSHSIANASRPFSTSPSTSAAKGRNESRYNYIANPFDSTPDPDADAYRLVTAKEMSNRSTPPKRVKMLARDFIDDCLYNPHYGYFSTQAVIFDPDAVSKKGKATSASGTGAGKAGVGSRAEGFEFGKMRNTTEFEDEIARRYGEFEGLDGVGEKGPGRQVWHTPTELFKPWYGRAIARYLVAEYKLNLYPYEDLIIYEIGAGNGTLMGDILDYIAEEEPAVYERTRYRIVEISERLQQMQKGRAAGGDAKASRKGPAKRKGHGSKVEVLAGSIFDFQKVVSEPCFFLAMEVLDNFAHDVIRYTTLDHEPLQCLVSIDSSGDFTELYEPVTDPLIARYLELRAKTPEYQRRPSPLLNPILAASPLLRSIFSAIPFAPNLTAPEFLPTKHLMLLDILRDKFPAHRVLFSDFSSLPDTIPGVNAPVVQTRYEGETVACTTMLVSPGHFDIFFPTDFHLLRDLYALIMSPSSTSSPSAGSSSSSPRVSADFFSPYTRRGVPSAAVEATMSGRSGARVVRGLKVLDHGEFLERWGEVDMTRLRDGSNPMVESYLNQKFLV